MQIYLLIADDRQGPFTPEQITEKIKAGECTAETLAWKDGMEEWKPLADVCPQPAAPPPLPETPAAKPAALAGGKNGFVAFFRAYGGLFQRIKNGPLPQPAQWYDRYPIIFPAAFLAFFFFGLGLIPLLLTSRLSGGDKGRLSLLAAWPLYLAMLPAIVPLVVVILFLLPLIFLPLMWFKKWFTPQMRHRLTAVLGGGFVALVALAYFLGMKQRGEATALFKSEPEKVLAMVASATNNVMTDYSATGEGEALIRRFKHVEDMALSASLDELQTALNTAKAKQEQASRESLKFSRQFAALESLSRDTFGAERFKKIEKSADVKGDVEFLQIHVQPPDLDAKSICMDILDFFVKAQEGGLLKGVEFVNFHFHADIIHQNGREENMEVLRLALSRRMIESTEWKGYDKYLHIDLVKHQLLTQADDSFFYSALDWKADGWKE